MKKQVYHIQVPNPKPRRSKSANIAFQSSVCQQGAAEGWADVEEGLSESDMSG